MEIDWVGDVTFRPDWGVWVERSGVEREFRQLYGLAYGKAYLELGVLGTAG